MHVKNKKKTFGNIFGWVFGGVTDGETKASWALKALFTKPKTLRAAVSLYAAVVLKAFSKAKR